MRENKFKVFQVSISTLMLLNTVPLEILASEVVGTRTHAYLQQEHLINTAIEKDEKIGYIENIEDDIKNEEDVDVVDSVLDEGYASLGDTAPLYEDLMKKDSKDLNKSEYDYEVEKEGYIDELTSRVDVSVSDELGLRTAISNAEPEVETVIKITQSFNFASEIAINGGRHITLIAPTYVILGMNGSSRHFNLTGASTHLRIAEGIIIDGLDVDSFGGGIATANGTLLELSGAVMRNNRHNGTGGAVRASGDVVITGGDFYNNFSMNSGGFIEIRDNGVLTFTGGTIHDNESVSFGGGIHVSGNGGTSTLIMDGGVIKNNRTGIQGGGISSESIAIVNSGSIVSNTAPTGGGISTRNFGGLVGSIELNGGLIANNTATNGGGINIHAGTFNMTGGEIRDNTASSSGGGLRLLGAGALVGEVSISNNTSGIGGGIHVVETGSLKMDGGIVSNNRATVYGGGLSLDHMATRATIFGVHMEGNHSPNGGAIEVRNGGELTLENSILRGNRAYNGGGGLRVLLGSNATLQNNVIENNTAIWGGGIDALGTPNGDTGLTSINDRLVNNTADIGGGLQVTRDARVELKDGEVIGNRALLDGGGVHIEIDSTMTIENTQVSGNSAGVSGGGLKSQNANTFLTDVAIINNNADTGGGISLTNSYLVANGVLIETNVSNINSGGIDVRGPSSEFIFNSGTINNNTALNGAGIGIHSNAHVIMNGGEITNNTAISGGGGVLVSQGGGIFTLNDGNISDNNAGTHGGGIWVNTQAAHRHREVIMNGGTISYNTAGNRGGGIYVDTEGVLNISEGTISNNTAHRGGGLELNGSEGIIENAIISGNTATQNAGGIHVGNSSTAVIRATVIEGNNAIAAGAGGLHTVSDSHVILEGSTIQDNKSRGSGGGLRVSHNSQFEIIDSNIKGNSTETSGGGIHIYGDSDVFIQSTILSENAALNGGGLSVQRGTDFSRESTLILKDVDILSNIANFMGGGLRAFNGSEVKISNSNIHENRAVDGGGLHATDATVVAISDSDIFGNIAISEGGGAWMSGNKMYLTDVIVESNEAARGGGINAAADTILELHDTKVIANNAQDLGGGIRVIDNVELNLLNTYIDYNSALTSGAIHTIANVQMLMHGGSMSNNKAVSGTGGAMRATGNTLISIHDAILNNNTSESSGGALWVGDQVYLSISNTTLGYNKSIRNNGGAIGVSGAPTLEILNSIFEYNKASNGAGGALQLNGSARTDILNSRFDGNIAGRTGGAINKITLTETRIKDSALNGNKAYSGGGLFVTDSVSLELDKVLMEDNVAQGTDALEGGGAIAASGTASILIDSSRVEGNTSTRVGGGIFIQDNTKLSLNGTSITYNTSNFGGGGLRVDGEASLYATNGVWRGNISNTTGGALSIRGETNSELRGLSIIENEANDGGALHISGNTKTKLKDTLIASNIAAQRGGAAQVNVSAALTLINSELKGNTASRGGGINLQADAVVRTVGSIFNNNTALIGGAIFTDNLLSLTTAEDTDFRDNTASEVIDYSRFKGRNPNLNFASTSTGAHVLNNYDIGIETHTVTINHVNKQGNVIQETTIVLTERGEIIALQEVLESISGHRAMYITLNGERLELQDTLAITEDTELNIIYYSTLIVVDVPINLDFTASENSGGIISSEDFIFKNYSDLAVGIYLDDVNAVDLQGINWVSEATAAGDMELNMTGINSNEMLINLSPFMNNKTNLVVLDPGADFGFNMTGRYIGTIPLAGLRPQLDFDFTFRLLE